jgi:hypothetical protein
MRHSMSRKVRQIPHSMRCFKWNRKWSKWTTSGASFDALARRIVSISEGWKFLRIAFPANR